MSTILTPSLPMRLHLHPYGQEDYRYVIGIIFEPTEDEEVSFSYICTNGCLYNDYGYRPECFIDGEWVNYDSE